MTELHYRSATELAKMITAGELTARAVTEHVLERIRTVNDSVNAVVDVDEDEALAQADRVDAAAETGALRGVPITVKDARPETRRRVEGLHHALASIRNVLGDVLLVLWRRADDIPARHRCRGVMPSHGVASRTTGVARSGDASC